MTSGKSKWWYHWMRDFRCLQSGKQSALCNMAYGVEECMFIIKTFYQTCSFVTVQRQFQRKFNTRQAPARLAISRLVQKFESTGSVCDNKKGVVGRHRSARMQGNVARTHEALLRSPRKSVTRCSQSLGMKTSTHTIMRRDLTLYPYRILVAQMLTAANKQRRCESGLLTVCAAVRHLRLPVV
jgi:hypothetical protein